MGTYDGFLSSEDKEIAMAITEQAGQPGSGQSGEDGRVNAHVRDLQEGEGSLQRRKEEVNARLAQHDTEYQQFHAQEVRRIEAKAAKWAERSEDSIEGHGF